MPVAADFGTISEMFDKVTSKFANSERPMLMHKVDKEYIGISYKEYRTRVEQFALGLASLGVKRGDRLSIVAENRPDWVISDMAMVILGAVNVPIYPTLTPKQIEYIFNDAGVKVAVVSNLYQLNKVLKIQKEVKTLKHMIVMSEKDAPTGGSVLAFSSVLNMGREYQRENPDHLRKSMAQIKQEDLLTLIYTSGTTGNPKGVMLSHRNLVTNIKSSSEIISLGEDDVLLSFLPLCHSFERMAGYYTAMACGSTVAYAESVETVRDNLIEVRPTVVTTVPRLFERIHSRIQKQVDSSPAARRKIFQWALKVGKDHAKARKAGSIPATLQAKHRIASKLVFSKLKERTGGRIKYFVSGGAALPKMLGEFFEAVGIQILEGYGLTETSPVLTANRMDDYKFGTVGKPIAGVQIKIAEDGEILAKGPNIMLGYYNNTKATAEVIDKEGWFHTGDIGMFDAEGHLVITDRKKHLFVSSGGKNIAPQPIENLFLESKYVDQFILIGDGKMFLTALIVPEYEILKEFAADRRIVYNDQKDLALDGDVRKLFQTEIDRLQKDLPAFERVRRFELLPEALTVEADEITPTMKVKRRSVEKKYSHLINKMYADIS